MPRSIAGQFELFDPAAIASQNSLPTGIFASFANDWQNQIRSAAPIGKTPVSAIYLFYQSPTADILEISRTSPPHKRGPTLNSMHAGVTFGAGVYGKLGATKDDIVLPGNSQIAIQVSLFNLHEALRLIWSEIRGRRSLQGTTLVQDSAGPLLIKELVLLGSDQGDSLTTMIAGSYSISVLGFSFPDVPFSLSYTERLGLSSGKIVEFPPNSSRTVNPSAAKNAFQTVEGAFGFWLALSGPLGAAGIFAGVEAIDNAVNLKLQSIQYQLLLPILHMIVGMIPTKMLVPNASKKFDIPFDSFDIPVGSTDSSGRTNVWWLFKDDEADVWDGISSSANISFYSASSPVLSDRTASVSLDGRKTFAYPVSNSYKTWTEVYTAIPSDEVESPTFQWSITDA